MGAIVSVESGGNPFAVSINYPQTLAAQGRNVPEIAVQPRSVAEASRLVQSLASQGFSTSLGLAQISSEHLEEFRLALTQLFDPCTNQRQVGGAPAGAAPQQLIARTLSCYNSGNDTLGLRNGYVDAIVAQARMLSAAH